MQKNAGLKSPYGLPRLPVRQLAGSRQNGSGGCWRKPDWQIWRAQTFRSSHGHLLFQCTIGLMKKSSCKMAFGCLSKMALGSPMAGCWKPLISLGSMATSCNLQKQSFIRRSENFTSAQGWVAKNNAGRYIRTTRRLLRLKIPKLEYLDFQ